MTNYDLALRAEQAVLGALLQDPSLRERIAYLQADGFGHPTYRQLFTELSTSTAAPDLPERVAGRLGLPGLDAHYLRGLAAASPASSDVAVYARMVQEASVRRQLAAHAERISMGASFGGGDPAPGHHDRLAQALSRLNLPRPDVHFDVAPAVYQAPTAEVVYTVDDRGRREELVLADLLQHEDQVREVEVWLSPETFEAGLRREVYEAITAVYAQGEPVNELTVAWELSRQESTVVYAEEVEVDREPAGPAYLAHLMTSAVVVGVAVEVGHQLFVEDLRTELAAEAVRAVAAEQRAEQPAPKQTAAQNLGPQQQVDFSREQRQVRTQEVAQPSPPRPAPDDQPRPRL